MPLLLGIPIIAGLVGLFAGAQVDRAVDNATTPIAGKSESMPWWVIVPLVVIAIVIGLKLVKKYIKI
ncbi:MAG: hypothetical protein WC547_09700 [Candidatus Omnitrophota bacterium]